MPIVLSKKLKEINSSLKLGTIIRPKAKKGNLNKSLDFKLPSISFSGKGNDNGENKIKKYFNQKSVNRNLKNFIVNTYLNQIYWNAEDPASFDKMKFYSLHKNLKYHR